MENFLHNVAVWLLNGAVVSICVILHYEFLYRLTRWIPKLPIPHRSRIVVGVFGALIAHAIEVWIFAFAYYFMHHAEGWGHFVGSENADLLDCVYYSFTTFSTLGFGDIVPRGDLRYLTGIESLTGLVLITWSASFLFLEMQSNWTVNENGEENGSD